MSDERQASAIDRLVGAIGFTQMQVATTCAEGHDLTPPRPLLDALDEVRRYIAALEADRARLDWLEAHAREGRDDNGQQTRVEFIHGMPGVPGATQESGFYVRQWSETPDDEEGNPDFRRRSYRQSPRFATLRDALDAALSSSPLAPTQEGAT